MSNLWTRTRLGDMTGTLRGVWSGSLLQKFTGILGANASNNFAAFLITVYAARALGPEEFGRLSLTISITLLLALILARMAALTLLLLVVPKTALSACLTSAGVLVVGELIVYATLWFKNAGHDIVGSRK